MTLLDRSWVSKAPKLKRVPQFDGMRGIGVFGVMAGHSFGANTLSFSAIVDIFFVISGFLITTLLLQEHRSTGHVALKKFYARRSLRLLPLLYVVLIVNGIGGLIAKYAGALDGTGFYIKDLVKESAAAGAYVYNWVYPLPGGPWLAHLWTLSVEEQFYLFVGVTMLVVLQRGGIRIFTYALLALTVAIQLSRAFMWFGPFGRVAVGTWIHRPDSLMVGMLCALLSANMSAASAEKRQSLLRILGWVGVVGIVVSVWLSTTMFAHVTGINISYSPSSDAVNHALDQGASRLSDGHVYWLQWGSTLAAWSFLLVTLCAFRTDRWWPNVITTWAPLVWIGGNLSYGLYVWHYIVNHFLRIILGTAPWDPHHERLPMAWYLQLALDVIIPFAFAIPSYYWVERKALQIKDHFAVERVAEPAEPAPSAPATTTPAG